MKTSCHLVAAAVLVGTAAGVPAQTLLTPGYRVTIEPRCPEGEVGCAEVGYRGVSRRSGRAIRLEGHTLHTRCADGVTPCRFLGWEFRNRDTVYRVLESGELRVTRGEQVLVQEQGVWCP
ncbi:hypothetical protein [Rubrivivax gelatinosus]|jgi:hypothetical protein|uniref:Uncharacterized protein n=1 Tax=Rubrivivax gelatinosus TaxID=28068 RepID=A0A4R2LU94_RUBGE|nr:hypothetical protein [Rubrivivax gelatinosus]MBK1690514.1 hypothetical protein [Rubrivivax gelatinosus]TCO97641.1 hypothetical protein EV684_1212 [Rubrivivax gelatinosus]